MASALYGTVLGSLIGGWPTDRFGRKLTLLFIGILYIVGAVGSALADDPYVFIAARVIGAWVSASRRWQRRFTFLKSRHPNTADVSRDVQFISSSES